MFRTPWPTLSRESNTTIWRGTAGSARVRRARSRSMRQYQCRLGLRAARPDEARRPSASNAALRLRNRLNQPNSLGLCAHHFDYEPISFMDDLVCGPAFGSGRCWKSRTSSICRRSARSAPSCPVGLKSPAEASSAAGLQAMETEFARVMAMGSLPQLYAGLLAAVPACRRQAGSMRLKLIDAILTHVHRARCRLLSAGNLPAPRRMPACVSIRRVSTKPLPNFESAIAIAKQQQRALFQLSRRHEPGPRLGGAGNMPEKGTAPLARSGRRIRRRMTTAPELAVSAPILWPRTRADRRAGRAAYVFIESKNSLLFLVLRSLSSRKSMASMVPIGLRMRRSTYIFLS